MALSGCFTSHLLAASHARDAALSNVRVAVTGTLDGAPERFTAFTLEVSAACNDAALAQKLIAISGEHGVSGGEYPSPSRTDSDRVRRCND